MEEIPDFGIFLQTLDGCFLRSGKTLGAKRLVSGDLSAVGAERITANGMIVLQSLQKDDNVVSMANGKSRAVGMRMSEEDYKILVQAAAVNKRKIADYCRLVSLERAEQDLQAAGQKEELRKQPSAA